MADDAQTLFRQGVKALRETKDRETARRLLTQSLKLDPQNDMAWLWLSQTSSDPQKRLKCVERALELNPGNQQARTLIRQLREKYFSLEGDSFDDAAQEEAASTRHELTAADQHKIETFMARAEDHLEAGELGDAIEQWVRVLEMQPDHEIALRNAVRYYYRLKLPDEAHELVWDAIKSGTKKASIYLTGIDIARQTADYAKVDALYEDLAILPSPDGHLLTMAVDHFLAAEQPLRAQMLLEKAVEKHPNDPGLLRRLGDLHAGLQNQQAANHYYSKAAELGQGTKEGKAAQKLLGEAPAVLTDKERGSTILAVREAMGFAVFYLFLGWQDAGLNFANFGSGRLLGMLLSVAGGYFVITATSSPQQQPLARWLGGKIPEDVPDSDIDGLVHEPSNIPMISVEVRAILGIVGIILLAVAFWLVFSTAIHLLFNPVPVPDLPGIEQIFGPEIANIYYNGG